MGRVSIRIEDRAGNFSETSVNYTVGSAAKAVAGGYYIGSNGDVRPDTTARGMNLKSLTQYRSFADGSIFPGWQKDYISGLMTSNGLWPNYVVELKHYGAANQNAQTFTVDGRAYVVPAPNMTIQQRPSTTWPKAYGYGQVITGQCDGLFARALAQLRLMPAGRINIQLASEFDTDHEFGVTEGGISYTWEQADVRAVAAVKYIINYFKSRGVPAGVTFTAGMAGQWNRASFTRMHPEDLPVDYMHFNAYNHGENKSALARFKETLSWVRADLGPNMRKLDILVAEWGTNANWSGGQAAYISSVPAAIRTINAEQIARGEGQIVMTNYFSSRDKTWGLLDPKEAGLTALKTAYDTQPYGAVAPARKLVDKLKFWK